MPWQPIFPFLPILQVDANCLHMTIWQKYTIKQSDFCPLESSLSLCDWLGKMAVNAGFFPLNAEISAKITEFFVFTIFPTQSFFGPKLPQWFAALGR